MTSLTELCFQVSNVFEFTVFSEFVVITFIMYRIHVCGQYICSVCDINSQLTSESCKHIISICNRNMSYGMLR